MGGVCAGSPSRETQIRRPIELGLEFSSAFEPDSDYHLLNESLKEDLSMPTYMDMHDIPGVKAADVAGAHEADVKIQGNYGVNYKQYWVDEENGKVFCLVDAPDRETATRVHREAHGLEAHTLYEVEQGG
jgi:uncharacterized protein DUF4242